MREHEVCFIAPTEELARRAREIIQRKQLPIPVYTAALDEAVPVAREQMERGVWLFVSRRGTGDLLRKTFNATVVNISIEASDYIPAMEQVRGLKGSIAFFSYEPLSDMLRAICYLMQVDMRPYFFTDNASCEACVRQAMADGAVCGVGGIVSARYAEKLGMPYIIVESSDDAITQSVETACQMYELQKENARKQELLQIQLERFQKILDYTHDAIIAVDAQGRIEVLNRVAEGMLGGIKGPFSGKRIEEILPNTQLNVILEEQRTETDQLMNIHGTLVSTNRVPIVVNGKSEGAVATFQDIKALQSAERSIRIKLYEKGLIAKWQFPDIIGKSAAIIQTRALAQSFADAAFTVMLYGETGVGKEMFAQSIHNASDRREGPFVAVNCTALTETLLESELFGYADSSFTGAKKGGKAGLFELAHGGTIFLDEIGELPMEFQARFLRVLQEKEVRRVGGDSVIPVDIRVIGATNRDLAKMVEEGQFRRDLYYRLDVLSLRIPPLREREDDFLLIGEKLYSQVAAQATEEEHRTFLEVLSRFRGYRFAGNVRELTNMTERISLLQRQKLSADQIYSTLCGMLPEAGSREKEPSMGASGNLACMEADYVRAMLEQHEGNISRTARALGISRSTLYRKLHER